jgi:hypothetical protein
VEEDDAITVRYVGGSYDGGTTPLPAMLIADGYEQVLPARRRWDGVEAPDEPMILAPDADFERYVLQQDGDGLWLFNYTGTLGRT